MSPWPRILAAILFVLLSPILAGLLAGLDRIISARMQSRIGPPLLQPIYDLLKLFQKERIAVNRSGHFFLLGYLLFTILAGIEFFIGGDLLIVIFALALASVFFVLGAFAAGSPYSHIGAERELIQIMASEPMLIMCAMGFYVATGSFQVTTIHAQPTPLIATLPGIFLGMIYILTIKLRKSPFDLSTSHHAHQEIVKGITTEFAGPYLAIIELAHGYETILLLGFLYLFFAPWPLLALAVLIAVYFLEILADNTNARLYWQWVLRTSWAFTAIVGAGNLVLLHYLQRGGTP
ncbi:MAG: NADH-quinone oxidoreductase subunit H [Kiritimatiellae bacterium]|nr:NADH-quinone oxidoreductase subunit H [Kiritimatiellia bacterium]